MTVTPFPTPVGQGDGHLLGVQRRTFAAGWLSRRAKSCRRSTGAHRAPGTQRWLVATGSPDKLWGPVKEFWQETGFVLKLELPDAGVMETDWAENRAKISQDFIRNILGKVIDSVYSTAERDKFRTRLEPGITPGTTDIFISHRGMYEIFVSEGKDQTKWQPRPPDPELEAEMLRRLMIRLGSDEKRATAAIQAAQEKPVERASGFRAVQTVPAPSRSMNPSSAPGGESVWRLTVSVSPSSTGIAPGACTSFAMSILKRTTRRRRMVSSPS
jgi:hypothetical protein